jgi:RHS repeat-associated protein
MGKWAWRVLSGGLVPVLVVALVQSVPASAAPYTPPKPTLEKPVPGFAAKPKPVAVANNAKAYAPAAPVWPAAGTAEVALTSTAARAGSLPMSVSGSVAKVKVDLLDRATATRAGGTLMARLSRTDGLTGDTKVRLRVDYKAFASAYGADWSDRLRLMTVPDCAGCQATALPTTNDGSSVSADVPVTTSTLVLLAAAPSGGSGDYSATSLAASSVWSAGGSSGDFSWSYPIRTPPALGGPAPTISFAYSSQSVDGRMVASNNQPSWLGEGFEYSPGYIERRYVSCADDMGGPGANNTTASGDDCWKTDNATLNLNGGGGELIYNATEGRWHSRNDDGSKVERRTGASNGAKDGEYWVVTTATGTRYYFGLNRLSGWTTNKPETHSVLTEPVFGNNTNEPCHAATFAASACTQAWRWNLDYVVDPHGNTMSYWYQPETNQYGRNNSTTDLATYTRSATLLRIDYGTDQRTQSTDSEYLGVAAPAQVVFGTDDRCLSACTTHDAAHWPDTPWDQECKASPCQVNAPTYWSTRRLSSVTTKVWNGSGYTDVESFTLTHSFPDPGDGTRAGLWLDKISHTGLVGGSLKLPDVTFTGIPLNNRVDTALVNGLKPMNWRRIKTITTESGEVIDVTYSTPDCVKGTRMPSAPESNTLLCYPVRWTPPDPGKEIVDYFQKYVVTQVVENDMTDPPAGSPLTVTTAYQYLGNPAWHYSDDDGLTKDKFRTWSEWRGYGVVRVRKGTGSEQTLTENRYFRGMDGDHLPSGTRSASVTDSKSLATLSDVDSYAGMLRESITYNGPSGAAIAGEVTDPVQSAPTASRTINNVTVSARYVGTNGTHTWVALDGGRTDRWSHTASQLDSFGIPVAVTDFGDDAVTGDEECTLTDYARNTSAWLMTYPSRTRSYAMTCADATAPGRTFTAADVLGEVHTSYDGQAWGAAPTKGDVTAVDRMKSWQGSSGAFVTVARTGYDAYGRGIDAWDVDNNHTATAFTPASGGPVTRITVTSPVGWVSVTDLQPAWGATVATVDPNNRRTDLSYDPLGRMTGVWQPGRSKASGQSATTLFAYSLSNTAPSVVTTSSLSSDGGYTTSYTLYDALLRARQTQAPADGSGGGRVITDTFYDSAGRGSLSYGPYSATGAAGGTLFIPTNGHDDIPIWHKSTYDGAGRQTASIVNSRITEKWRTTTAYTGDRTDVTPPAGSSATSTLTDANGRTTELRQYHGPTPTGAYDSTSYAYDRKGRLTKVTAPDGVHWDYGYDLLGRQTSATDPDKGSATISYDDAGRVLSTTDSRGTTLAYSYDTLGRRTGEYLNSTSGTQLAGWTYDGITSGGTSISRGMLTSSTRFVNGQPYTTSTTRLDAAGRPTEQQVSIPSSETGLSGTYPYASTFRVDGSLASLTVPAIGGTSGLPAETLTYGYNALGKPATLGTSIGSTSYVSATSYTQFGEASDTTLRNAGGPVVDVVRSYEDGTHRLQRVWETRETNPATLSDLSYSYDASGNITRTVETSPVAGAETQCFGYDYLRRLSGAWTPSSGDCSAAPSANALGGPAPYWLSWSYDVAGNRTGQVNHTQSGDLTTRYAYPAAAQAHPHGVTGSTTTASGGAVIASSSYGYDNAGNTVARGSQNLTWDAEGRLATVADGSGTTSFVYDADGNRLIRRDPQGTTLYLAGQELRVSSGGQVSAVRYYTHAGQVIAMRTATGLTWLLPDSQGTAETSLDSVTQAVTRRWQTPFGTPRGPAGSWPNDKGFVGGTQDNTGLTHLGAREYDPGIGRFISVDPVFDAGDPQQMEGYSYAANNPVVYSDPSGLMHSADGGSAPPRGSDLVGPAATYSCYYSGIGCNSAHDPVVPTTNPNPQPKKKCGTFDVKCHVKQASNTLKNAYHATVNWVDQHKAELAGLAVGLLVGSVCTVATFGMGAVGCAIVAGAVGGALASATTYGVEVAEGKHGFGWSDFGKTVGLGAAFGAIGGLAGVGVGKLAGWGAGKLANTSVGKAAVNAAKGLLGRGGGAEDGAGAVASGAHGGGGPVRGGPGTRPELKIGDDGEGPWGTSHALQDAGEFAGQDVEASHAIQEGAEEGAHKAVHDAVAPLRDAVSNCTTAVITNAPPPTIGPVPAHAEPGGAVLQFMLLAAYAGKGVIRLIRGLGK